MDGKTNLGGGNTRGTPWRTRAAQRTVRNPGRVKLDAECPRYLHGISDYSHSDNEQGGKNAHYR